jgi:ssDNA-binding replication factor A large subunit
LVIYKNLKNRLGHPKEMNLQQSKIEPSANQPEITMKIPPQVIKSNLDVEDHEIAYAEGGFIPILKLSPTLKWNWRIKGRVTKKSERRTWKNERGEGYLMNIDLIDEEGSHI